MGHMWHKSASRQKKGAISGMKTRRKGGEEKGGGGPPLPDLTATVGSTLYKLQREGGGDSARASPSPQRARLSRLPLLCLLPPKRARVASLIAMGLFTALAGGRAPSRPQMYTGYALLVLLLLQVPWFAVQRPSGGVAEVRHAPARAHPPLSILPSHRVRTSTPRPPPPARARREGTRDSAAELSCSARPSSFSHARASSQRVLVRGC